MHPFKLLSGLCLGLLGSLAAASPGFAQSVPAASAPVAAVSGSAPAQPVSTLYARLTEIEHSRGSFAQRAQLLAPVVDQVFNLPVVLQNSLGLRFRTVPEGQKQQLLEQFRQFTVARYVSNFAAGGTDTFKVDPAVTPSPVAGDQIVHTQIIASGASTDINYVMRQGAAGWQVVDVLLNGNISQVAVQRADFGSSLTSGDATSLIDSLRKKTQAFSES
jgi:phospholipid transport system substrate-binding protein